MGWLLAIILAVLLYAARQEIRALRARVAAGEAERQRTLTASRALAILRLQLSHMLEAGELDESDFRRAADQIDACWTSDQAHAQPARGGELWWSCCEAGWNMLIARGLVAHGPPPWRKEATATDPRAARNGPALETIAAGKVETSPAGPAPAAPGKTKAVGPEKRTAAAAGNEPASQRRSATPVQDYAWRPAVPGPLERALRAVSGWPKVLMPFLVQNIGWFIGGFLFLAGSVFLVTYTSGFVKAAIVFTSLFAYTAFLIWAGYKLRQTRPPLTTASTVLLSTGLLLVPLTISAVTRLLMNASSSVLLWAIGIAAGATSLGVFYVAAQVVSGVVHRSLRGGYPRLFLAAAATQLGAPLIALWPAWQALAVVHFALLGVLAFGLLRFANEWLLSIFVDRKKVALFAAGSLLYAAVTSFVHLTWGISAVPLPTGYYAPYLMAVCGLLFYLDAQLKSHAHRHVFLSRFSFLVYGVSVVAVLLALNGPGARLITLAMALALYAMVLAKYLTLIPLYLMIASFAGLYADVILTPLPASMHFLFAVPGLCGLIVLSRWATQRGMSRPVSDPHGLQRVGSVTYRIALLLMVGLALWSLANSAPSVLAMATGLILSGSLAWQLRAAPSALDAFAPEPTHSPTPVNELEGPWLYAPIIALSAGLAFAPPIGDLPWPTQFAAASSLLSALWVALLVRGRRTAATRSAAQSEVYSNSALLSLFTGTALVAFSSLVNLQMSGLAIMVLAAGAGALLTLSLNLYVVWLFYASLLWSTAAAVAVKLIYFPQRSVGLTEMLGVAALWGLLWWLDRQPDELSAIARRRAWRGAPAQLLWLFPCASEEPISPAPAHDMDASSADARGKVSV